MTVLAAPALAMIRDPVPFYIASLERFIEGAARLPGNGQLPPEVIDIAARFNVSPEQVARDIGRVYLEQYYPLALNEI